MTAQRDGVLCDRLINDFDQKFDLAYPESHRKPKHHCIKHLRKYLILYGPFRNYTCFTGEGFLSLIKPMSIGIGIYFIDYMLCVSY